MELIDSNIILRRFSDYDIKELAELRNIKKIWDNLRDYIPFPYTENDTLEFLEYCKYESTQLTFSIDFNGEFAGSI